MAAGDALEAITGLEYGPYERAWRAALDAGEAANGWVAYPNRSVSTVSRIVIKDTSKADD